MPATKNLCAQIDLDLHQKISEAREHTGQTTSQYITDLLTEYFKMKENGGNEIMTNGKTRTLAFQIDETLFQRIKDHLVRESTRLGRNFTQREFVIGSSSRRWRRLSPTPRVVPMPPLLALVRPRRGRTRR